MAKFALRGLVTAALFAGVSLAAPLADAAGPYTMSVHIDGIAGGDGAGNYVVAAFAWGNPVTARAKGVAPEIDFTIAADSTSTSLMQAAQSKQAAATAELQVQLMGTTTVDILMTNAHFESTQITSSADSSTPPSQKVVLRFEQVLYTFQPVLPNGQKSGPPVTFSATFH